MRLIDAEALMELYADTEEINFAIYNVPIPVVRQNILDMPTIEAEPVQHGRWIMKETMIRSPYAKNAYCSECLEETSYTHNYCPNCGCKMDKEE